MDELASLNSLGLSLPSPAYLVGMVLFGLWGMVVFRRGRKVSSFNLMITGAVLMFYPYLVSLTWLLWLLGAGLCAWAYFSWNG